MIYDLAGISNRPNARSRGVGQVASATHGRVWEFCVHVFDVDQGLLSVSKVVRIGSRVVFDNENSIVEN